MWPLTELTEWLHLLVFLKRKCLGLYKLGLHNVALSRIDEVAASTRFSYKRFALTKK